MKSPTVTARRRPLILANIIEHLTAAPHVVPFGPPTPELDRLNKDDTKKYALSDKVFFGCTMAALDPGATYVAPEYNNTDLINCDLRALTYDRSVLTDFTFVNCDLTGAALVRTLLDHVTFIDCDLTRINLTGSLLRDVEIRGCTITGAVFTRAFIAGLRHDASPEALASTLLRSAANFPSPLPAPYEFADGYPHPAGPFAGTPVTHNVPLVTFSQTWAQALADSCGLTLRTVATLLSEHQHLSPTEIAGLCRALSPR